MSEFGDGGIGRSPPHNLEAERSALGGVLIKPSAIDDLLTGVMADDFFLPAHREEMDNKQDDTLRGKAELIIGKHRHGPTGEVPLTFIREYTRFENYAEEMDEPL